MELIKDLKSNNGRKPSIYHIIADCVNIDSILVARLDG